MRRAFVLVWLLACKERGTISVPLTQPCDAREPAAIAVYLVRSAECATFACGLRQFDCAEPNCVAGCPDGYCTPAEIEAGLEIDPPTSGDYALVMSYRYDGQTDGGIVCYSLQVDADGTQSMSVDQGEAACCIAP